MALARAVGNREHYAELVRADEEAAGARPGQACEALGVLPGFIAYVYTEAEGFKRRELTVRAALYEVATRRRIPDPENYRALARVPIDAPTAASVQEIWLYDPGQSRRYFARVALYDSEDHLLHISDSGPFTRISDRELAGLPHECTATF